MRLWTLHPRYLDAPGLVAVWREGLLARAVLREQTRGYRHHPQLERFKSHAFPVLAINSYLAKIHSEAVSRGYRFDRSRFGSVREIELIPATMGQIDYEWGHLLAKLRRRTPRVYETLCDSTSIDPHPLFDVQPGPIAPWERTEDSR